MFTFIIRVCVKNDEAALLVVVTCLTVTSKNSKQTVFVTKLQLQQDDSYVHN